jgi:hypothetical protein
VGRSWRAAQALDNFVPYHRLGSVQATARGKWCNPDTLHNCDAMHLSVFKDDKERKETDEEVEKEHLKLRKPRVR